MKILVGTLHSGEREFGRCCQSIAMQTMPPAEHLVIEGLSARDAHVKLFTEFVSRAAEFDLLVKVDADMVLARKTLIAELAEVFNTRQDIHHYQIAVHDWYTDRLVFGMNVYRNTVRWKFDESIFVENSKLLRLHVNGNDCEFPASASIHDKCQLAPAAFHSPDPSPGQAFHFGLHKGVKVVEAVANGWERRAHEHGENIELSYAHYLRSKDRRLLLAALGGEIAVARGLPTDFATYREPCAAALTEEVCGLNEGQLVAAMNEARESRRADRRPLVDFCRMKREGQVRYFGRRCLSYCLPSWLRPLVRLMR